MKQPWVHLGDGTQADLTPEHWLHIPSNFYTTNGGGESYEFQPFTPNWGLEFSVWFPVEGLAAQAFQTFITDSWARIGAAFQNCAGIRMVHAPALGGNSVRVDEFANVMSSANTRAIWASPLAFYGSWIHVKAWVQADQYMMVWINDVYLGSCKISDGFKLGPRRRCVRFLNTGLCDAWLDWIDHYDRPSSVPPLEAWSSLFYDDFNRTNGSAGNGWTQLGANAGIANNAWSLTGTVNGATGLYRNTGLTSGKTRVEAVIGGNIPPHNVNSSGLVLCSNAAGDQGLMAAVVTGGLYIMRFTGPLNSATFTIVDQITEGISVQNGDKVSFSVYNDIGWVELNGVPRLYSADIHRVVPASNSHAGLFMVRDSDANSASWNDVRIYSGL
ncbi:hypothetical protein ACWDYH_00185 [Nocardia goodfellowii]